MLLKLLARQTSSFAAAPQEAKAVSGEKCPTGTDPRQFAPWVIVSRAVLNLDETITRE